MFEQDVDEIESSSIDHCEYEKIKQKVGKESYKKDLLSFYDKLRSKFNSNDDRLKNKITDYLFILPDFFMLLVRLLFEKRVDKKTKTFLAGIIAYILLPIDLIPDFIPVIGYVDDLIITVIGLSHIFNDLENDILIENWSGKSDMFLTVKKILSLLDHDSRLMKNIKNFFNGLRG